MKSKTMKSKLEDAERRAFLAEKKLSEMTEPQDKVAARRVRELAEQIEEQREEIAKYRRLLVDITEADTPYRRAKALRAIRAVLGVKEAEPIPAPVPVKPKKAKVEPVELPPDPEPEPEKAPLVPPPDAGTIPCGWMLAGAQDDLYIIRPGDGSWMQIEGMEYARIGRDRWTKVYSATSGTPSLKGVMYRLPWPVPAGTIPKEVVL